MVVSSSVILNIIYNDTTSSKTYQLQVAKIQGSGNGSGFDANNNNYGLVVELLYWRLHNEYSIRKQSKHCKWYNDYNSYW